MKNFKSIVISPECSPFWEKRHKLFVVLAVADEVNALGVALGLQIIGHELHKQGDVDVDFAALSENESTSKTLFSNRLIDEADIIGISVPNICVIPSMFSFLSENGIPILRSERKLYAHPYIVVGGLGTINPAPMEKFVDAFVIGEGTLAMKKLVKTFERNKQKGTSIDKLENELLSIPGVYMPSIYKFEYNGTKLTNIQPEFKVDFQRTLHLAGTRRASLFTKPHRAIILMDYSCKFKCNYCQMSHARGSYDYWDNRKCIEVFA